MDKLIFYEYFPQKKSGRPPITQINILRYLSRYGKSRRAKIANYFSKKNQEINDAIKKLVKQDLVINYCDVCKKKIGKYDVWKHHKNTIKHKSNFKVIKNNKIIEKSKPLIMVTKIGLKVAIYDPMKNYEFNYAYENELKVGQWNVITTRQFWNILTDIFYNSNDFDSLENICNNYEQNILKIFREHVYPYYFRKGLQEFKKSNLNLLLFYKNKNDNIFFEQLILEKIAYSKSLNVSKTYVYKEIIKKYRYDQKIFEKDFEKLLTKGIIEIISKKSHEYYQITHLGLILLFHFLASESMFYKKHSSELQKIVDSIRLKNTSDEKTFHNNFEHIRKKYSYLLPMILNDENFSKLNLTMIGFLEILDEMCFFDHKNTDDFFGNHNFENFKKFYEIRNIDFGKKLENHINSYNITKTSFMERSNKMMEASKTISKKSIKLHKKMLDSEIDRINSLVYIKNEFDRMWTPYYSADMFFHTYHIHNDKNYALRKRLSHIFKQQIITSIENKITFDFYSTYKKYNSQFNIDFTNNKINNWYTKQIEQLSQYVSHYFENMIY